MLVDEAVDEGAARRVADRVAVSGDDLEGAVRVPEQVAARRRRVGEAFERAVELAEEASHRAEQRRRLRLRVGQDRARQVRDQADEPAVRIADCGSAGRRNQAGQGQRGRPGGEPREGVVLELENLAPFCGARDLQHEGAALGRESEVLVAFARQRARGRREPVQVPREVDGVLVLEADHRGSSVPVTVGVGEISAKTAGR